MRFDSAHRIPGFLPEIFKTEDDMEKKYNPFLIRFSMGSGKMFNARFVTEEAAYKFCDYLDGRMKRGSCGGYIMTRLSETLIEKMYDCSGDCDTCPHRKRVPGDYDRIDREPRYYCDYEEV